MKIPLNRDETRVAYFVAQLRNRLAGDDLQYEAWRERILLAELEDSGEDYWDLFEEDDEEEAA